MGWSLGYDWSQGRDIGYGVPAMCDHPGCREIIDRGLGCVCGGGPYGDSPCGDDEENGCGLFFCGKHLWFRWCEKCKDKQLDTFTPKPDLKRWTRWKLMHPSWNEWRRGVFMLHWKSRRVSSLKEKAKTQRKYDTLSNVRRRKRLRELTKERFNDLCRNQPRSSDY